MEHSQFKVLYYPKRDLPANVNVWETTPVDLYSYLDFNCQETTEKKQDGSNLPFIKKVLYEGTATYTTSTRVYTFTGTNFETNIFKWHTLIDKNDNRYVIQGNTATTITLAPTTSFNFYGTPQTGQVRIELPDFEEDDIIVCQGWKIRDNTYAEPADFGDKILFTGQVISRGVKHDNRGTQINLKLGNMTELMLKTTQKWDIPSSQYSTTIDKIQHVLAVLNGRNQGAIQVNWSASNPSTKLNGAPFLSEHYFKDDSSAYDVIYDLSTKPHTGDTVEYYTYLRPVSANLFELVWQPKNITTATTIYEGADFDFISWNNEKVDAISSLLFRCGRDANNNNITQIVHGSFKKGSRGYRYAEDIASEIINGERSANPASFNFDVSKYPTSYNYTTATSVTADEVAALAGTNYSSFINAVGTYVITSNSNYNKFVRYVAKARAVIRGKAFLDKNNKVRDKVVVRFYATPAAKIPGSTGKFVIYTLGWTGGSAGQKDYRKDLRLVTKTVGVDSNGIYSECTYLEDENKVVIT